MTKKEDVPRMAKKRRYRVPKLKKHGNLKTMTMVKGGALGDAGGKPSTRSSGSPA